MLVRMPDLLAGAVIREALRLNFNLSDTETSPEWKDFKNFNPLSIVSLILDTNALITQAVEEKKANYRQRKLTEQQSAPYITRACACAPALGSNQVREVTSKGVTKIGSISSKEDMNEYNNACAREAFKSSASGDTLSPFDRFIQFLHDRCPNVIAARNFSHLITPMEFDRLRARFSAETIANAAVAIDNRRDLLPKYSNFYATLRNWCARDVKS